MPNPVISQITLPSGTTYDIKDATARAAIEAITGGDAVVFIGVSTSAITDGGTQTPTITDWTGPAKSGNLVFYGSQEYVYGTDDKWHALGDLSTLGALAQKDSATASYQPAGTNSAPTFTGASSTVTITTTSNTNGNYQPAGTISVPTFTGKTMSSSGTYTPAGSVTVTTSATANKTAAVSSTTGTATYTPAGSVSAPTISVKTAGSTTAINNPTKVTVAKTVVAAAPGATAPANEVTYYSVSGEVLSLYQLGYTTGDSISTASVTVKTGDAAYESSEPTFSGTGTRLVTGNIAVPNSYTATFNGTEATIEVSGTTTGSVSSPSFTGTKVQISGSTTASGSVSAPTFTGTTATITVS